MSLSRVPTAELLMELESRRLASRLVVCSSASLILLNSAMSRAHILEMMRADRMKILARTLCDEKLIQTRYQYDAQMDELTGMHEVTIIRPLGEHVPDDKAIEQAIRASRNGGR